MSGPPRAALVVVNYGSSALLQANLATTARDAQATVVVVDSFSTTSERARLRDLSGTHGWQLLEPATNVGFGAGMNLGVTHALALGAGCVVLLNPDLAIDGGAVRALVARATAEPRALVAPRIMAPTGLSFAAGTTDLLLDDGTMRASGRRPTVPDGRPYVSWLSGACLALTADLWRTVGGFDDDYFLYWEDVDLSRRVQEAGGILVVDPEIVAVHQEGGTQGRGLQRAKSEIYYYYNIRNRLLYAALWLSEAERSRWWRTTPRAVRSVILQGGRRQLVTSVAPWRAAVRGVRDGRRLLRSRAPRNS